MTEDERARSTEPASSEASSKPDPKPVPVTEFEYDTRLIKMETMGSVTGNPSYQELLLKLAREEIENEKKKSADD